MPSPTTEHHAEPPRQPPSPNVARQGAQPTATPVERPDPVLFDDIEPVHFVRLYPEEVQMSAARAKALEAGNAAKAFGDTLVAAQQQPVVILGEPVPTQQPAPRPTPEPPHAQQQPADKRG